MNQVSIQEFYKGKSVFVTGATGFLGKVLVEKLLWSCPDLENIYITVRAKKGKSVQERVDEITNCPAFDRIRENHPEYLNKIVALEGDITMENLGMSDEDLETFLSKVNVIFHSAASVRLNESIKMAFENNTLSTRRLINLAKRIKNFEAFVHISTAYSNFYQEHTYEEVYLPSHDPKKIAQMINLMPDNIEEKARPILLNSLESLRPFPNTYTYSKFYAESFVALEGEGIPRAIVRPSIVVSSMNEPVKGWIDSYGGSAERVMQVSNGLVRHIEGNPSLKFQLVPVDMVINCSIAVGWRTAIDKPKEVQVYNSSSEMVNPIFFKDFFKAVVESAQKYPFDRVIWLPTIKTSNDFLSRKFLPFFYHTIPAYLIDLSRKVQGKKPVMVKLQTILHDIFEDIKFGTNNPAYFHTEKSQKLFSTLSMNDQKEFPFDMRTIKWKEFMDSYVYGVKKYLLKEDCSAEALKKGREKMKRLKLIHQATKLFLIGTPVLLASGLIYKKFNKTNE